MSDNTSKVMLEVSMELARAMVKFPTWPTDPLHALAVLGEEFGELTKDALQLTYEPHKTSPENVRKEAIQTAAMAIRFAISLDRYEYRQAEQHKQSGDGKSVGECMMALAVVRELTGTQQGGLESTIESVRAAVRDLKDKQQQIDSLMLEFCPGAMTDEQREQWAVNLRRSQDAWGGGHV